MQDQQLSRLRRKLEYYRHDAPDWVRIVWPRPQSFAWFIKNRRGDLEARGALLRLGRDHFIDAGIFPVVAGQLLGTPDEVLAGMRSPAQSRRSAVYRHPAREVRS